MTCIIDTILGEISYYLNGQFLGVAFDTVDCSKTWYPAASLTSDEGGIMFFGSKLDPLRYCPEDSKPVSDLLFSGGACTLATDNHTSLIDFRLHNSSNTNANNYLVIGKYSGKSRKIGMKCGALQNYLEIAKDYCTNHQIGSEPIRIDIQVHEADRVGIFITDNTLRLEFGQMQVNIQFPSQNSYLFVEMDRYLLR